MHRVLFACAFGLLGKLIAVTVRLVSTLIISHMKTGITVTRIVDWKLTKRMLKLNKVTCARFLISRRRGLRAVTAFLLASTVRSRWDSESSFGF